MLEIIETIIAMLDTNKADKYNIGETFENWCEQGEVFENENSKKLMLEVAPYVDNLTQKLAELYMKYEGGN